MTETPAKPNLSPVGLAIDGVSVCLDGKKYRLTREHVLKAFERAHAGDVMGPYARYVLEVGEDLKTVESVFRELVPVSKDRLGQAELELIAEVFRTLGFEVLDYREHHLL